MNWYYATLSNYWLKLATQPPQPPMPPGGEQPQDDGMSDEDLRNMIPKMREDAAREKMKRQPLGNIIKEHHGVWPYPFYKIKPANGQGWVINWFDDPGGIHDLNEVNVGDKIADANLNHTPYWEVSGIDENKGQIFLTPLENNMWATGVGAGGKQIDDHDRAVASGEYEDESINHHLERLQKKQYANPGDVAYILKGTVPVHVGPNGSQGGWYACQDHHARGYQEGLDTAAIIQKDATSLKRLGFDVPAKGLDGTISPQLWNDYINGQNNSTSPEKDVDMHVPGEDLNDPQKLATMVLNHPEPNVKKRNFDRLKALIRGDAKERELLNQLYAGSSKNPAYQGKEGEERLYEMDNQIRTAWKEGKYARQDLLPILRSVVSQMPRMEHGNSKNLGFDAYAQVKEKGMYAARDNGWDDLLQQFEAAPDKVTRHFLIQCYRNYGEDGKKGIPGLERIEQRETDAENLKDILYGLESAGVDVRSIVMKNPQKFQNAMKLTGDGTRDYYAKDLQQYMARHKLLGATPERRPDTEWNPLG